MTERERLIELIKSGGKLAVEENHKHIKEFVKNHGRYNSKTDDNVSFEEIVADYLLSNGVIVLPCNIGDTVYVIVNWCDYTNCHFEGCAGCFNCNNKGIVERKFNYSMIEDFGKTVFLTREEAETKLKEVTE